MEHLKLSTLFNEEQIQKRVKEIAQKIMQSGKDKDWVAIGVLKGSFLFYADLIRELDMDMACDFCGASSYGNTMASSGEVRLTMDVQHPIHGKDILIIEDIVDTGLTLNFLKKHFASKKPRSITTAALLLKPDALKEDCKVDHVGFEVGNEFVVGYGLDYQGHFRHLPYIARVENMN